MTNYYEIAPCTLHYITLLDTVLKIWATLRKLFAPPGVPRLLWACWCAKGALHLCFKRRIVYSTISNSIPVCCQQQRLRSRKRAKKALDCMAMQFDKEYLPKGRQTTFCASVHSAFFPMTTKWQCRFCCLAQAKLAVILFCEIYYFKWVTYCNVVRGLPPNVTVFRKIRHFGWRYLLCTIKKRIPKAFFPGEKLCLFLK